MMPDSNRPVVLSVASFIGVRLIDGGDTVAVSFQAPDGREVAVVVPHRAAADLQVSLSDVLALPSRNNRGSD